LIVWLLTVQMLSGTDKFSFILPECWPTFWPLSNVLPVSTAGPKEGLVYFALLLLVMTLHALS